MLEQYGIIALGALVLIFVAIKGVIDMAASIEYATGTFPRLAKWAESKGWQRMMLTLTLIFYVGTLYEMLKQPSSPPICSNNPGTTEITRIAQDDSELRRRLALLTKAAPRNSLRRQTIDLVTEINLFWADRPSPTQQPIPNPATDADRAHNDKLERDWKELTLAYNSRQFNERIVGIAKQYAAKGVPVGYLERSSEQPERLIGAGPYGGYSLDNCAQFMSDLCQLRELAFHVDAYGERIDSSKF
jgi:hypothetical protein